MAVALGDLETGSGCQSSFGRPLSSQGKTIVCCVFQLRFDKVCGVGRKDGKGERVRGDNGIDHYSARSFT